MLWQMLMTTLATMIMTIVWIIIMILMKMEIINTAILDDILMHVNKYANVHI